MDDIGRFPYPVVCYCATCGCEWAWGKNEFLGVEFTCPEEKDQKHKHLARLILDKRPAYCWLRIEWGLHFWQTRISSFGTRLEAGIDISLWFLILILALLSESQYGGSVVCCTRYFFGILLAYRFIDIILVNLSITFTTKFLANLLRSVLLTGAGYVQIILFYAYLYAAMGKSYFPKYETVWQAVYFSFGTIFTVGYGNLMARDLLSCFVVASELLVGLLFIVIVLGQIVAWTNQPNYSKGEFPLDYVKLRP